MKKAFTLVELIVVITILAILWTIAFISLSWYSKEARDSKRVTDTSSLLSKINIEEVKWRQFSELITKTEDVELKILGTENSPVKTFWRANFENLKEAPENFKDPSNKSQDYPLAFAIGWTWRDAYKFVQIATISEKDNKNIIKWNYYKLEDSDAVSLFHSWTTTYEESKLPLVYEIDKWGNNTWWNTSWGWETANWTCKSYTAWNWTFTEWKPTSEDIDWQTTDSTWACYVKCDTDHYWNWTLCNKVEIWTDPNTWFKWELNPSWEEQWAECTLDENDIKYCENYPEPTWNWKWYTYPEWRTEDDYPAFKHCTKLWAGWRLPTKNELATTINYRTKNTTASWWAFSNHPNVKDDTRYWTSTASASYTNFAFRIEFRYVYTNNGSKNTNNSVLCTHD